MTRSARQCAALAATTLFLVSAWSCGGRAPEPRLIVTIVVDQMRADFLERFDPLYQGGFRRLVDGGAVFPDAAYRHAVTVTGAGHGTVATGLHPARHGVVGNSWWNYETGKDYNCVEDPAEQAVGGPGLNRSPRTLLADTLGDRLKEKHPGAKVVGLSSKDRGALLMVGRNADGAFWYSADCGCFVTSSYFGAEPPAWLEKFNAAKPAGRWAGQSWERLIDDPALYERHAREDHFPTENDGENTAFPHRLPAEPGAAYYKALGETPFADQLTLEAALAAIEAYDLGGDATPDLLTIGFSATDGIGHAFGPFSQEAMDQHLRLDRMLGELLDALDRRVGLANVAIGLTADHGALPLAETVDGKRIASAEIASIVNDAVRQRMPAIAKAAVNVNAGNVYLDLGAISAAGASLDDVETAAIAGLMATGDVERVYTKVDLEGPEPANDPYWQLHRNSFYEPRSPQLLVMWNEGVYPGGKFGTGHGSPHAYDRDVPVLLFGYGVRAGRYPGEAGPEDLSPTLGRIVGVEMPLESDTRLLEEALAPAK